MITQPVWGTHGVSNEARGQRELQAVQGDGLRLLRGRGAQCAHALRRWGVGGGKGEREERRESRVLEEKGGESRSYVVN